jgi:hypothetical protein
MREALKVNGRRPNKLIMSARGAVIARRCTNSRLFWRVPGDGRGSATGRRRAFADERPDQAGKQWRFSGKLRRIMAVPRGRVAKAAKNLVD